MRKFIDCDRCERGGAHEHEMTALTPGPAGDVWINYHNLCDDCFSAIRGLRKLFRIENESYSQSTCCCDSERRVLISDGDREIQVLGEHGGTTTPEARILAKTICDLLNLAPR